MPHKVGGRIFYSVSEACKLAKTNRDTYLRWVREGRVADVTHRDRNGWRLFTREDVRQLETRVNRVETVVRKASRRT